MVFKPLDSQVALSQKESGSRIVSYGPLIEKSKSCKPASNTILERVFAFLAFQIATNRYHLFGRNSVSNSSRVLLLTEWS